MGYLSNVVRPVVKELARWRDLLGKFRLSLLEGLRNVRCFPESIKRTVKPNRLSKVGECLP